MDTMTEALPFAGGMLARVTADWPTMPGVPEGWGVSLFVLGPDARYKPGWVTLSSDRVVALRKSLTMAQSELPSLAARRGPSLTRDLTPEGLAGELYNSLFLYLRS